ncbi:hypothetical protein DCAR_0832341 [Daucus carota subsp. sativus]|uniref:CRAL-TRIO domain-containing protein n=1 Tax=Daucus carota subsp. sativus TaxID=79200 RepID=A0A175YPT8_DAUCS|nr:hypothetical protein DCAR_0832341 [Daucus carota subsp. sativus]
MGKKDQQHHHSSHQDKVEAVLNLLRKQAPLTLKQEKFCSIGCVERFLKARGENVKKAAKQLRACLSWRDAISIENLIADEFSTELAEGLAFVSGFDDDSRPVLIFRIKQDYHKFHSQKQFTRLLVFTLEVARQSMAKDVDQFVLLFDAKADNGGQQRAGLEFDLNELSTPEMDLALSESVSEIIYIFAAIYFPLVLPYL